MSQLKCTADGLVKITDEDQAFLNAVKAQDETWAAGANDRLAAEERKKRTALLVETDHYALVDVTMPDAMKTYRQALRDVPQQAGFPSSITWPDKP